MNINKNRSKTDNVLFGVPQGSILGPLFFRKKNLSDLPNIRDSFRSADLYASKLLKKVIDTINFVKLFVDFITYTQR